MKNQMDKLKKLCIKWLNKNFNPMEPFYIEEYPDYIFHMKDGRCILQYEKKSGCIYVNYQEIWKFFESYFSMDNQQIKDITKIWVEEHYKMGVTTTSREIVETSKLVEEHYKMVVTTIYESNPVINDVVGENYKMVVTETKGVDTYGMMKVKEQYNIQTNG
jgi:hypothetical protein